MADSLYFLRSEVAQMIKVGRSCNVDQRLAQLRQQRRLGDLEAVAVFPGRGEEECLVLNSWRKHRIRGEWFRAEPDLCKWIAEGCCLDSLPCQEQTEAMQLGRRILGMRTARGFTQIALAKKIRIRQGHLSQLENASFDPLVSTLRRIAKALGVEVSELID